MAARRRRSTYSALGEDGGELNLTPLLDVIFNLIFFFILATTIRQEDRFFELTLPESSEAPPRQIEQIIPEIGVSADGTLALNGEEMEPDSLREELIRMVEEDNVQRAVLSADEDATVRQATRATDLLYEAGIRETMQRVRRQR